MEGMRILLVDDHAILIDGIQSLLERAGYQIVCQAESAEMALEFLKKNEVDLMITDFNMPGMDGLSLIHTVKRLNANIKIILLSMHDEVHLVKEILKAGINGYVLKKDTQHELLQAIKEVAAGKVFLSNDINKLLIVNLQNPDEGKLLTDREREIVKLIAKEYTNKQIGRAHV